MDEVAGVGRAAPQKLTITAHQWSRFCRIMKQTEAGNRIVFYPVPRFRRRNATAKIEPVNGLRVEIFSRTLRKNTTRPLTGLIGGTGGEVLIVLGG